MPPRSHVPTSTFSKLRDVVWTGSIPLALEPEAYTVQIVGTVKMGQLGGKGMSKSVMSS